MNWQELESQADEAALEARRCVYAGQSLENLRRMMDEAEGAGEHGVAGELCVAFDAKRSHMPTKRYREALKEIVALATVESTKQTEIAERALRA